MLDEDEVCVVTARTDTAGERDLARCRELLSRDELERHDRFVFERDRRMFAIAHALLRRTLSLHSPGTEPAAWRFRVGPHGKPAIDAPGDSSPPRFNISHCEGLVACAVARSWELGIDVENVGRTASDMAIARSSFAPAEVAALERLHPELLRDAFFALWTLKEAYIKARGLGLSLPLAEFAFTLDPLSVSFDERLGDDRSLWHFERRRPTASHVLALAMRRPAGAEVRVTYREAAP